MKIQSSFFEKTGIRAGIVILLILASFLVVHGLLNWLAHGTQLWEWILGLLICADCIFLASRAGRIKDAGRET